MRIITGDRTGTGPGGRAWVHAEAPDGRPSAAAYRTGCRCAACCGMYREYLREYRRSVAAAREHPDGTAVYHTHRGRPGSGTALRWGCTHPRCLALGGLVLDGAGVVRDAVSGAAAEGFGVPVATGIQKLEKNKKAV